MRESDGSAILIIGIPNGTITNRSGICSCSPGIEIPYSIVLQSRYTDKKNEGEALMGATRSGNPLKVSRGRSVFWLVIACLLLGLAGCATDPENKATESDIAPAEQGSGNPLDPGALSRLETVPCWFDDPGTLPLASCFRMHVPEHHGRVDSRVISFPVVRISNPWGQSDKTPVLHLGGGGPGNPMGLDRETVDSWIWTWYQQLSLGDNRDLYLLDPRGVGLADPVLVCTEYIPGFLASLGRNLTIEQELKWNLEVNQRCIDRLTTDGIDVAAYNSLAVARDMELLRQAAGVDNWNLYGVSYGSRYALTLAREYPETVSSMVLDAAVFPHVRYMDNYADNLQSAFQRLLDHCSNSESCSNALGDPTWRFWQLVRNLDRQPVITMVRHPDRDQQINLVLNGSRFLSVMYNALYDADKFDQLDEIVLTLENGKLGVFEDYVNDWLAFQTDDDYGDASAAAHYCFEESPFIDYPLAIANAGRLRNELRESAIALLEFNRDQCKRWPVPPGGDIEGEPVVTDIPTLFLHGALDPVLPVSDLEAQLIYFSNADYEIFSDTSHSIVGVHPCGEQLASAFYEYRLEFRKHTHCMALQ